MKLSHRLETIASFVRRGSIIADIGTDHGYIPIYLVKEGISPRALAMDVRKGPLERAKRHVHEYGLEDRICLRQSDGLHKLEAGVAFCAGMLGVELVCVFLPQTELFVPFAAFFVAVCLVLCIFDAARKAALCILLGAAVGMASVLHTANRLE